MRYMEQASNSFYNKLLIKIWFDPCKYIHDFLFTFLLSYHLPYLNIQWAMHARKKDCLIDWF